MCALPTHLADLLAMYVSLEQGKALIEESALADAMPEMMHLVGVIRVAPTSSTVTVDSMSDQQFNQCVQTLAEALVREVRVLVQDVLDDAIVRAMLSNSQTSEIAAHNLDLQNKIQAVVAYSNEAIAQVSMSMHIGITDPP